MSRPSSSRRVRCAGCSKAVLAEDIHVSHQKGAHKDERLCHTCYEEYFGGGGGGGGKTTTAGGGGTTTAGGGGGGGGVKPCSICSQEKLKAAYSQSQWKKGAGAHRVCKDCRESIGGADIVQHDDEFHQGTVVCGVCHGTGGRHQGTECRGCEGVGRQNSCDSCDGSGHSKSTSKGNKTDLCVKCVGHGGLPTQTAGGGGMAPSAAEVVRVNFPGVPIPKKFHQYNLVGTTGGRGNRLESAKALDAYARINSPGEDTRPGMLLVRQDASGGPFSFTTFQDDDGQFGPWHHATGGETWDSYYDSGDQVVNQAFNTTEIWWFNKKPAIPLNKVSQKQEKEDDGTMKCDKCHSVCPKKYDGLCDPCGKLWSKCNRCKKLVGAGDVDGIGMCGACSQYYADNPGDHPFGTGW